MNTPTVNKEQTKERSPASSQKVKKKAKSKAKPVKGMTEPKDTVTADDQQCPNLTTTELSTKLKAILKMVKAPIKPSIPSCHGECKKSVKVENNLKLIQFIQKGNIFGQITERVMGARLGLGAAILLFTAGQGYNKEDFLKVKAAIMRAD